jgi:hypothetical protein
MTLQLSHRALTDALTFNLVLCALIYVSWLLEAVGDPAASEVVGRELYSDAVAGQDPDEIHPELSADMSENAVTVFKLDCEHRVG